LLGRKKPISEDEVLAIVGPPKKVDWSTAISEEAAS
jgi:hypothetical protein